MAVTAKKIMGEKVIVTQIRSTSGRSKDVVGTVNALGLGKINSSKEHTMSPMIYGMLKKVEHLVTVDLLK